MIEKTVFASPVEYFRECEPISVLDSLEFRICWRKYQGAAIECRIECRFCTSRCARRSIVFSRASMLFHVIPEVKLIEPVHRRRRLNGAE